MNQNTKFDNILNECLDRILKGEQIEECLRKYPEQARELEPLLRTAMAARAFSTVQPRPEFKSRARYEFQAALQEMAARKKQRRSFFNWRWDWRPQIRWQSGWAIAAISALVVVLGGGGTVAAASSSMPDSALYSVKLAAETVQLAVTPSDIGKAELNSKFANRRAEEIGYMAGKGDAQAVQGVVARLNTNLENMTLIAGGDISQNASPGSGSNMLTAGTEAATPTVQNEQPIPQVMLGAASTAASTSEDSKAGVMQAQPSMSIASVPNPNATPGDVSASGLAPDIIISPPDNSIDVVINPTFRWDFHGGNPTFDFRLSETEDFSAIVDSVDGLKATQYSTTVTLKANTDYFWEFRAKDDHAVSQWNSFRFRTGSEQAVTVPAPKALDGARNGPVSVPGPAEANTTGAGGGQAVTSSDNNLYERRISADQERKADENTDREL